jgi:hypothetical protein
MTKWRILHVLQTDIYSDSVAYMLRDDKGHSVIPLIDDFHFHTHRKSYNFYEFRAPVAHLTAHAATVSDVYFCNSCATVFSDLVVPKNLSKALYNIL